MNGGEERSRGNTIGRALDILEYVNNRRFPFSKYELAAHIGCDHRTAHRWILSLEARGCGEARAADDTGSDHDVECEAMSHRALTAPQVEQPADSITFEVPGPAATQGSTKAFVVNGRARVVHDSKRTLPWRKSVRARALAKFHGKPWDGPVRVSASFFFEKPKSRRKRDRYADRQPDLDKLQRALGDALEGIVVTNDSRIVEWRAVKAFGEPRTLVTVEALEAVL